MKEHYFLITSRPKTCIAPFTRNALDTTGGTAASRHSRNTPWAPRAAPRARSCATRLCQRESPHRRPAAAAPRSRPGRRGELRRPLPTGSGKEDSLSQGKAGQQQPPPATRAEETISAPQGISLIPALLASRTAATTAVRRAAGRCRRAVGEPAALPGARRRASPQRPRPGRAAKAVGSGGATGPGRGP